MTQKIAVAVIHGIGTQPSTFSREITDALNERLQPICGKHGVIIRPVYWAPALDAAERRLWGHLQRGGVMRWQPERKLLIDFLGDAFAYQITDTDRHVYDTIHARYAKTLKALAKAAGPKAPLCIIAHSLGAVITSNFIYDLQFDTPKNPLISSDVRRAMGDPPTPLELGETLNLLYTMGSPLALWSLRYRRFGKPIRVPDHRLKLHYPELGWEWINFYDADDPIGFPLKTLNKRYRDVVNEDREVNVGNLLTIWNPLSHLGYWKDNDVVKPIADKLIDIWKTVNP
ncbi:MAG: chemotaxis protein [Chloroflexota bacterium]